MIEKLRRGFGSDNHSGVHPRLMQALVDCNVSHAPSYGTDPWTLNAEKVFQAHFGKTCEVYFVFNGTASNALAMSALLKSYETLICTDVSHLQNDECGAPEFFSGAKLTCVPSKNGKLSVHDIKASLIRRGDQHFSQSRAVSITQPTELGTVYSLQEIREIVEFAHAQGLWVHMDGARIANAARFLGVSFQEMTTDLGVDVVSFGGTKNGFLFGEALLFLNPKLSENFKYLRKQAAQLPSKSRFISAAFCEYLGTDLWQQIADHEIQMARALRKAVAKFSRLRITQETQSNAVFVEIPKELIKELRKELFFYVWNETSFECRLMTSWDTELIDIEKFENLLMEFAK